MYFVAVFEILVRVSEGKSFKEALESVLPKRKEVVLVKSEDDIGKQNLLNNEDMKQI